MMLNSNKKIWFLRYQTALWKMEFSIEIFYSNVIEKNIQIPV